MNETKADMYGSYLAVFSFAVVMVVLPLFFDSRVGSVLWALVAWQIYKRDKSTLVSTLTLLFWFIVIGLIVSMAWLLLGPPNLNLRQFVEAEGPLLAISAGLLWWMHSFFEKSPTAADIFNPVVAQAPASPGIAAVENPAPPPAANVVAAQVPAGAEIATVETAAPRRTAGNVFGRVFSRARQVASWRRRPRQRASAGDPPASLSETAPTPPLSETAPTPPLSETAPAPPAVPKQNAALVESKAAETAFLPPAVSKQVVAVPGIRAEPSVSPTTVAPESQDTIPPRTIIDDERIYAKVANELETGGMAKGLWTRLYAECDGDEKRTKVLYIRQRAERLIAAERARRLK